MPFSIKSFKFYYSLTALLLFNYLTLILSYDPKFILIQFKTKNLREEDDDDDEEGGYVDPDEEGMRPYFPPFTNETSFINEWFYNGIFSQLSVSENKELYSLISLQNSKFNVDACTFSSLIVGNDYFPKNSSTFNKNSNGGSDNFRFVSDLKYQNKVTENLNFLFKENNEKNKLCGYIGLNLNSDNENTNIVEQLKKKSAINKYIFSIIYQTEEDGIIVFGEEPHYFENTTYYMSQYRKIYTIPNKDKSKTSWTTEYSDIFLNLKTEKKILENTKAEFYLEHGLIIGTNEYKTKINELFFDKLVQEEICFIKTVQLNFNSNDEYYIYYCKTSSFKALSEFPDLVFYYKNYNKTFTLNKIDLFQEKHNRTYFLVIFEKNEKNGDVWKLGEPFFSKNKLVFDQDKKMIGFYNENLPKISNEEYSNTEIDEFGNPTKHTDNNVMFYVLVIGGCVIVLGCLIVLAFCLGKKLNEQRKKRANELNDDEFDYTNKENNVLFKNDTENNKE